MGSANKALNQGIQRVAETLYSCKNLRKLSQAAVVSLVAYAICSKLYSAFWGPLSAIPCPTKLKLFGLEVVGGSEDVFGLRWKTILEYHKRYGKVVRLGPRSIVISDKDMIRQVLQKDDLPKGSTYKNLQKLNGNNLFSTTDIELHKQRRRALSPAFSGKYIHSLEPFMAMMTKALLQRIDRDIADSRNSDGYGVVDIWRLLQYLAIDIIGETAFGRTFHMLEGEDHFIPRFIKKTLAAFLCYPIRGTIVLIFNFRGLFTENFKLAQYMKGLIEERLDGGEATRRNDILQILIDTQGAKEDNERLTSEAIVSEIVLFLVAGSDTTSNTIGFAIIELLKNPDTLATLRKEIDAIPMEKGQTLIQHDQLKNLPYLNAVINETLRLDTVAVGGLERYADRDIILGGRIFIPKGTAIRASIYHAHLNPEYWPEPNSFLPERWLEGSKIPADTEAFFPFSIGSRNCIGKAFAQQEMRLSIANILRRYDLHAFPDDLAKSDSRTAFLTLGVKNNSFKVAIRRRENIAEL
ncbi:cytochrome P450 [Dichotomocladium elegans]|nr:cytochrome P450 [Dichotomocladium elegans]